MFQPIDASEGPMKWFGTAWDAPICTTTEQVPVPVGKVCMHCDKPIEATHRGLVLLHHGEATEPTEVVTHLYCFAKSLGHDPGN